MTDEEIAEGYAITNWEWYEDGQRDYIAIKQAFLAGLKAGRPKWHKVADGYLPKETGLLMSKTLLLITKMKGSTCLNIALGQYNFSTQEFSYQHIAGLIDVIAWKEIVLPKEIKEK